MRAIVILAATAEAVVAVAIRHVPAGCMARAGQTGSIGRAVRSQACIAASNPQLLEIVECASQSWPRAEKPPMSHGGAAEAEDLHYPLDRSSR
jgi:hypothetical protein